MRPLEVTRRAGHTSTSFTQDRYGHLFPEDEDALAARLDALVVVSSPIAGEVRILTSAAKKAEA